MEPCSPSELVPHYLDQRYAPAIYTLCVIQRISGTVFLHLRFTYLLTYYYLLAYFVSRLPAVMCERRRVMRTLLVLEQFFLQLVAPLSK